MKFEINTDSIAVNIDETIAEDPSFLEIIINKGYFGLFSEIKLYQEFIIQAIAYENLNQPHLKNPFSTPNPLYSKLSCTSDPDVDSNSDCIPDEAPDIGLFISSCPLYQDTLTTANSCMNSCSGSGWEKCTCSAKNFNSQMLFNNNNKTLCRPFDYINFAKMETNKIRDLNTAKRENKCTLQFWMFAYSYTDNGFGGITF